MNHPARRLPVRATVNASYAIFFKAPWTFTIIALVPLAGLAATVVFASTATNWMVADGDNWSPAIALAGLLTYVVLVFCIGMLVAGTAHVVRGDGFPLKATLTANLRRLPSMMMASAHVAITLVAVEYTLISWSGPFTFGLALVMVFIDLTILSFVFVASRVEGRGPLTSLLRSEALSRGNLGRLFGSFFFSLLPISFSAGIIKAVTPDLVGYAVSIFLSGALQLAALSIVSVVAYEALTGSKEHARETNTIDDEIVRTFD